MRVLTLSVRPGEVVLGVSDFMHILNARGCVVEDPLFPSFPGRLPMISEPIQEALNDQLNVEFFTTYN